MVAALAKHFNVSFLAFDPFRANNNGSSGDSQVPVFQPFVLDAEPATLSDSGGDVSDTMSVGTDQVSIFFFNYYFFFSNQIEI